MVNKPLLFILATLFIAQTSCSLTERLETAQTEIVMVRQNIADHENQFSECDTCKECIEIGSCNPYCDNK